MKRWVLAACLALAGCGGSDADAVQAIRVTTTPAGAACWFERLGVQLAWIGATPGSAVVARSPQAMQVRCVKAGYRMAVATLKPTSDGRTLDDMLHGSAMGHLLTPELARRFSYPESVHVALVPAGGLR